MSDEIIPIPRELVEDIHTEGLLISDSAYNMVQYIRHASVPDFSRVSSKVPTHILYERRRIQLPARLILARKAREHLEECFKELKEGCLRDLRR